MHSCLTQRYLVQVEIMEIWMLDDVARLIDFRMALFLSCLAQITTIDTLPFLISDSRCILIYII